MQRRRRQQFPEHGRPAHMVVCAHAIERHDHRAWMLIGEEADGAGQGIGSCRGLKGELKGGRCLHDVVGGLHRNGPADEASPDGSHHNSAHFAVLLIQRAHASQSDCLRDLGRKFSLREGARKLDEGFPGAVVVEKNACVFIPQSSDIWRRAPPRCPKCTRQHTLVKEGVGATLARIRQPPGGWA